MLNIMLTLFHCAEFYTFITTYIRLFAIASLTALQCDKGMVNNYKN